MIFTAEQAFESNVNSQRYKTTAKTALQTAQFESNVNSQGYKTAPTVFVITSPFESNVNSQRYKTHCADYIPHDRLRVM